EPSGEIEQEVAGIWTQVLGVARVGARDNFFELGGHSLLATQVMFSVSEKFKVELPLRTLFESPTVAELAQAIEKARSITVTTIAPLSRERYRVKGSVRQKGTLSQALGKEQDA
ncbi:MAG: phosphopantetheine-binding protein, partial [Acidobacteria bacterium]|nr:phosphopantetheine-binding protein [Acidobacteriota bacterium]